MNKENYDYENDLDDLLKHIAEMKLDGVENDQLEIKINEFEKKLNDKFGDKLNDIEAKKENGESYSKEEEIELYLILIKLRVEFGNKFIKLTYHKEKKYNPLMMIGVTGCGKTCISNILSTENASVKYDGVAMYEYGKQSSKSDTTLPRKYINDKCDLIIWDTPGLFDTKTTDVDISNFYYITRIRSIYDNQDGNDKKLIYTFVLDITNFNRSGKKNNFEIIEDFYNLFNCKKEDDSSYNDDKFQTEKFNEVLESTILILNKTWNDELDKNYFSNRLDEVKRDYIKEPKKMAILVEFFSFFWDKEQNNNSRTIVIQNPPNNYKEGESVPFNLVVNKLEKIVEVMNNENRKFVKITKYIPKDPELIKNLNYNAYNAFKINGINLINTLTSIFYSHIEPEKSKELQQSYEYNESNNFIFFEKLNLLDKNINKNLEDINERILNLCLKELIVNEELKKILIDSYYVYNFFNKLAPNDDNLKELKLELPNNIDNFFENLENKIHNTINRKFIEINRKFIEFKDNISRWYLEYISISKNIDENKKMITCENFEKEISRYDELILINNEFQDDLNNKLMVDENMLNDKLYIMYSLINLKESTKNEISDYLIELSAYIINRLKFINVIEHNQLMKHKFQDYCKEKDEVKKIKDTIIQNTNEICQKERERLENDFLTRVISYHFEKIFKELVMEMKNQERFKLNDIKKHISKINSLGKLKNYENLIEEYRDLANKIILEAERERIENDFDEIEKCHDVIKTSKKMEDFDFCNVNKQFKKDKIDVFKKILEKELDFSKKLIKVKQD